jgi:hypothetical protein
MNEEQPLEQAPQEQPVEVPQEVEQPALHEEQAEPTQEVEQPVETEQVFETPQVEQVIEDDEVEDLPSYPQYQQQQQTPIDISQLPMDAEGNVDPNAFANAIYQNAVQQANVQAQRTVNEQLREQKLWQQAEKAYPEIATDKELRGMVNNARLGEMAASLGEKNPSPKQVADRIFKKINTAKASGVEQATNNVRVQNSATLESSSTTGSGDTQRIQQAAFSGDQDARRQYLRNLMDSGEIRLGE